MSSSSNPERIIFRTWVPPEEPAHTYNERLRKLGKELMDAIHGGRDFHAEKKALESAKFWRKRMPFLRKLLMWGFSQYIANACYRLDYLPTDLIMEMVQYLSHYATYCIDVGGVFIETTQNKYLEWKFARHIPKNIYDNNTATRRLFFLTLSLHSFAKTVERNFMAIKSTMLLDGGRLGADNEKVLLARQKILSAVELNLQDPSHVGTIAELLRLVSLNFKKYAGVDSKHHPFNLHSQKLDGIRFRVTTHFSKIQELFDTKLNEESMSKNTKETIEEVEYCIQDIMTKISTEHANIKELITVVETDGFFSKSVSVQIVQSFPKGSSERASTTSILRKEGKIPSEKSMRQLLKWCETRPIVDQRWKRERGRKRKTIYSGTWIGSIMIDTHPIEMKETKWDWTPNRWDELMTPIITMDLFSTAKRIDLCNFLLKREFTRLYFCPKQFSVPFDLKRAFEVDSFKRLKWFIEYSSAQGNSPVKYQDSSGKSIEKSARFRCKCYIKKKHCPFSFYVKADQYGYYLHNYNHEQKKFVGWKCHEH